MAARKACVSEESVKPAKAAAPKKPIVIKLQKRGSDSDSDDDSSGMNQVPLKLKGRLVAGTLKYETTMHGLIDDVRMASDAKRPFAIWPHQFYLAIVQAIGIQLDKNPERFRKLLGVKHEEKQALIVEHDGLSSGDSITDATPKWEAVFPVFAGMMNMSIGKEAADIMNLTFSTSTPLSEVVQSIAFMSACKSYFKFIVVSRGLTPAMQCGIPAIHLYGTEQDWLSMLKVLDFAKTWDLEEWLVPLRTIIQHIATACIYKAKPNKAFWKELFAVAPSQDSETTTGWIYAFTPYTPLGDDIKFTTFTPPSEWKKYNFVKQMKMRSIFNGISIAPFTWVQAGTTTDMEFHAGFMTSALHEHDEVVSPKQGWSVRSLGKSSKKEVASCKEAISTATRVEIPQKKRKANTGEESAKKRVKKNKLISE